MAQRRDRFCIFCGEKPVDKTDEHVLPQWLIKLTGKPNRVVNFGVNPLTGQQPRFDWSSFVFPACEQCNGSFSGLEGSVKPIVEKLIAREAATASEYVFLLDWLDKVRIGLWLGYSYLHRNPVGISPTFHINERVGRKDRMVAVYTIESELPGLNAHGAETLCFQVQPSCFSLRINSVYLLNMSHDFMCAARCGFPYPHSAVIDLDKGGMLEASDFRIATTAKNPISRTKLLKPSIQMWQPILQLSADDYGVDHERLQPNLFVGSDRMGPLYRQLDGRIQAISDPDAAIENDTVTGHQCSRLQDIVAQTYALQFDILAGQNYRCADPRELAKTKARDKVLGVQNRQYGRAFRTWSGPWPEPE